MSAPIIRLARIGAISALLPALVVFAGLMSGALPRGTTATFAGQTTNPNNALATAALYAPTSLIAGPVGHDVQAGWSPGQNGSGYAVLGDVGASGGDCSGLTFGSLGASAATAYTDTGRYLPQGTWYCYQVQTTYGPWTSVLNNPTAAAQIGFVANSVRMTNDGDHSACSGKGDQQYGGAGTMDCGDQIVLTFNQPVDTATGPGGSNTVCVYRTSGPIWLGSPTTNGGCSATETVYVGGLTGGTIGNCNCRFQAVYAWSNGNRTLTITVGRRVGGSGYPSVSTSVWTFTPTSVSGKMLSATGGFPICSSNAGGGNCLPSTSSASALVVGAAAAPPATSTATPTAASPTSTPTVAQATPASTNGPASPAPAIGAASPTPTATLPAGSTPVPTATPTSTAVANTATSSPTSTATPTPTATPTATSSPAVTPSPTPTPTQTPVSPTPTATPSQTLVPSTATPTASATPAPPTATATASPTPRAPAPTPPGTPAAAPR